MENREVALCGSMKFIEQMKRLATDLQVLDISSYFPKEEEKELIRGDRGDEGYANEKGDYIHTHLVKIRHCEKVLVANFDKNGVRGYVGPNSLIELAFGYALDKKLYLLYPPGEQSCSSEILGLKPTILEGNLERLVK